MSMLTFRKHQQRLNHLPLMSIESELFGNKTFDKLIHESACKKAWRVLL